MRHINCYPQAGRGHPALPAALSRPESCDMIAPTRALISIRRPDQPPQRDHTSTISPHRCRSLLHVRAAIGFRSAVDRCQGAARGECRTSAICSPSRPAMSARPPRIRDDAYTRCAQRAVIGVAAGSPHTGRWCRCRCGRSASVAPVAPSNCAVIFISTLRLASTERVSAGKGPLRERQHRWLLGSKRAITLRPCLSRCPATGRLRALVRRGGTSCLAADRATRCLASTTSRACHVDDDFEEIDFTESPGCTSASPRPRRDATSTQARSPSPASRLPATTRRARCRDVDAQQ